MALLSHCGQWVQPSRRQTTGPLPKPRWLPLPQLLYAQGVKTVRQRRLGRVRHRVVCGTLEAVQQVLAACGWQSNTAFIERVTLTIRQQVAAVGRRAPPSAKARTAYASSWRCIPCTTMSVCLTPAYACRCSNPNRPTATALPNAGSRRHPPWPLG
jgi:hypothetical protein